MTDCPDVEALVRLPPDPEVVRHCRRCEACDAIAALGELREAQLDSDACVAAEIAVAESLQRGRAPSTAHFEECAACAEVAVRAHAFGPIGRRPSASARRRIVGLASALAALLLGAVVLALVLGSRAEPAVPLAATRETPRATTAAPLPTAPALPPVESVPKPGFAVPVVPVEPPAPPPIPSQAVSQPQALGYLTIVCDPFCERIVVDGRARGSSPLVRAPVAPGRRQVVLIKGSIRKRIAVTIIAGQVSARRVKMQISDLEEIE